jgi:hypothetical protein
MMNAETRNEFDVSDQIVAFKKKMAPKRDVLKRAYGEAKDSVSRAADKIRADNAAGRPTIPELSYRDVKDGKVSDAARAAIRKSGCAIVRGVFPAAQATDWFNDVGRYLEENDYEKKEVEKRSLDKYFSALKAGKPQIFNVYWSKPQVLARQDAKLAETRSFLDRLWTNYEGIFNPDLQCTYADRVRRRQPGDKTLGLSPHMDAGTVERWIDPGYQRVYERVFAGDWRGYDPFDAKHRLETREIPSPAVSSVFRTYQGWTALTQQGPKDGTLRVIPIAEGISYVLLRALQDDVPENELCGAAPGRALGIKPEWHAEMMAGTVSIPEVMPGDTVWWHTDICHSVADEHAGKEYASVIYIGSAPDCAKNRAYLPGQKAAFLAGKSPPDFAPMNFEIDFKGRAMESDLTDLGRRQMGF